VLFLTKEALYNRKHVRKEKRMENIISQIRLPHLILYLIVINLLGFIVYISSLWCRKKFERFSLNWLVVIVGLLFGAFGELIALLIYERKSTKENLMMHVFVGVICIIEVFAVLVIQAIRAGNYHNGFAELFANTYLWIYILAINIISLACFGLDKFLATHQKSRIPNLVLLGLCFIGGSIGGLIGMQLFHHKTQKNYYTFGVPMMLFMQLLILVYIYFLR
jgi:uncharacterized membrane protein YsdA (DUF1294 family)